MSKVIGIEREGRAFEISGTFGRDASSKGMLYKWTGRIDNKLVYIKTGLKYTTKTYSNIQPITEVLVSDILDLFDINHVKYYYDELEKDGKIYPVCYSYDFAEDKKFNAIKGYIEVGNESSNTEQIYNTLCDDLGIKKELDNMIVIDFLINNIDRHLRNFGMLISEDLGTDFAPLFDHGHSLYGDILDEILIQDSPEDLELYDECKPFKDSHYEQIRLVNNVYFKVSLDDILGIVDKYKGMLSNHRINCIRYLLTTRYNVLKEEGIVGE